MALKKCPDCGKLVSSTAEACPNCGRPMAMSRKGNAFNPFHDPVHFIGLLIVLVFLGVLICWIVFWLGQGLSYW